MQALMSDSGQYVKSRDTYSEVQSRHEEIKRLERYMTELTTLANDSTSSKTGSEPDSPYAGPSLPKAWNPEAPYRYALPRDGDCWKECLKRVDKHDEERCRGWREDIDTLLVFAGLFSAVVTAFSVESYQWLDDGPDDATAHILYIIAASLNTTGLSVPEPEEFVPSASAVRINAYWFLSLTLSLTAVLVGILCKQWIREHRRDPSQYTSNKDHLLLWQIRRESLEIALLPGSTGTFMVLKHHRGDIGDHTGLAGGIGHFSDDCFANAVNVPAIIMDACDTMCIQVSPVMAFLPIRRPFTKVL
uniref:DUF6535 domain-containing protein n=1 Tax=Moniliophthora roreri TaxID=221103 RepID=A0A0W0G9E2_MONRR